MDTPRLAIAALAAVFASPVLPVLLVAQSAARPTFVVPNSSDIRIETRRTSDRHARLALTEILYLKGARQRWEERVESSSPANPSHVVSRAGSMVYISQCDQRRRLMLNPYVKTYAYDPIEDPAAYMARAKIDGGRRTPSSQAPPRPTTNAAPPTPTPSNTITIDAVDTGERKPFGRHVARHVITTRTIAYGPGDSTVDRMDGWYIDVPESNCISWGGGVTTALVAKTPGQPFSDVVVKSRGDTRRGYPIEETHHMGGPYPIVAKIELVDISESPLDDALFTVPADYQPALPHPYGGYDLTKPDTLLNRLQSYSQVAADWANYIRRHGLQGILPGTQSR